MWQLVAASAVWLAFGLVYVAALIHIRKIWKRGEKGPPVSRLLLILNSWRYYSWALLGTATMSLDAITGLLLVTTRIPAAVLIGTLNVQKDNQRPTVGLLLRRIGPELIIVLLVGNILVRVPYIPLLKWILCVLVAACFALLICPGIPRQIAAVRKNGAFGILRYLQQAQFLTYLVSLVYGFFVKVPDLGILMLAIYIVVSIEQGILVTLLTIKTAQWKREKGGVTT